VITATTANAIRLFGLPGDAGIVPSATELEQTC